MKIEDINSRKVRHIIFDLGGVVLDIDFMKTIEAINKMNIDGVDAERLLSDNNSLFLKLELGLIEPPQLIEKLIETYPALQQVSPEAIWDAWNELLQPFESDRIKLLKDLSKTYEIHLLSNTNLPHRICFGKRYQDQFGGKFEDLFTRCFYSDEMHLRKPDAEIYQQVEKNIRSAGSEILFIDDLQANIEAAKRSGWQAHLLTNGQKIADLFFT